MASFDNLVARKGSGYSSNSSAPSMSNVSHETRDISRQSQERARHEQRRAIQVRKVGFLVLVLLLIAGGLGYAIYRVVSNESDAQESSKVKIVEPQISLSGTRHSTVTALREHSSNTIHPQLSQITPLVTSSSQQPSSFTHEIPSSSYHEVLHHSHHETSSHYPAVVHTAAPPQVTYTTSSYYHHTALPRTSATSEHAQVTHDISSDYPASLHISSSAIPQIAQETILDYHESLHISPSEVLQVNQVTTSPIHTHSTLIAASQESQGTHATFASILIVSSSSSQIVSENAQVTKASSRSESASHVAAQGAHDTSSDKPSSNGYSTKVLSDETIASHHISTTIISQSDIQNMITSTSQSQTSSRDVSSTLSISEVMTSLSDALAVAYIVTTSSYSTATTRSIITSNSLVFTPQSSIVPFSAPYYKPWGTWSECSLDCGGGYRYRSRECSQLNQCNHLGPNTNRTICNMFKCINTIYQVSLNLTEYEWIDDYHNTSSQAYLDLVDILILQLQDLYGKNISVEDINISKGSVIFSFSITISATSSIDTLSAAIEQGKLGNISISLVDIINHMVPEGVSSISVQNITYNSSKIVWSVLGENMANGILLGYKISLQADNITMIDVPNPEQSEITVTGLTPDTNYIAHIFGYNINGGGAQKSATFKTNLRPPYYLAWGEWSNCSRDCGGGIQQRTRNCTHAGQCGHLGEPEQKEHCNVYKCNTTSFTVTTNLTNVEWTDDFNNKSSKAYQDLIASIIAELQKKYPNSTITIPDIIQGSVIVPIIITTPDGQTITIYSVREDLEEGIGNYTVEVNEVVDNNLPKSPPGSINITWITPHSAKLHWQAIPEEDSNGAILGYVLELTNEHNVTSVFNITAQAADTEFQYEFNELTPNSTHSFSINGYNINGNGVPSEVMHFITRVEIPQVTQISITDVTRNQATITWQGIPMNDETYGDIYGYKIEISENGQTMSHMASSSEQVKTIADLKIDTSYDITITAFNQYGDGITSAIYSFATKAVIPQPTSLTAKNITPNSALVDWQQVTSDESSYGVIEGTLVTVTSAGSKSFNVNVSGSESEVLLENLSSNTTYCVQVVAYNQYGMGHESDQHCFTTMAVIPQPTSLTAKNITPNSALVDWQQVTSDESSYGVIEGTLVTVTSAGSKSFNVNVSDSESEVLLENLLSNTTYCVQVVSYNQYGMGHQSDQHCFTTMAVIPQPTSLTAKDITPNSALVDWQQVTSDESSYGVIEGTLVTVTSAGSKSFNVNVSGSESDVLLENLSSNTTYCVQVVAYNQYGMGHESDQHCFTTMAVIPQPTSLTAKNITPNSALVDWQQVTSDEGSYGVIEGALVTVTSAGSKSFNVNVSGSESEVLLENLSSNTTYCVQVVAYNQYGMGHQSDQHCFTTMDRSSPSSSVMLHITSSSSSVSSSRPIVHLSPTSSNQALVTSTSSITDPNSSRTSSSIDIPSSSVIPSTTTYPRTSSSNPTFSTTQELEYVSGKIKLSNEVFTSDLSDPSTTVHQTMVTDIESELTTLFQDDGLNVDVTVLSFTKGSIVVNFYVAFVKTLNYTTDNVTYVLVKAMQGTGLGDKPFDINVNDFSVQSVRPTLPPTSPNEADKGLQKNSEDDNSALVVAIVICTLLSVGVVVVVIYIGKKRGWFKRNSRKVMPDDDDDDEDDDDFNDEPLPDRMRLSHTARGPRKPHGARMNEGSTAC